MWGHLRFACLFYFIFAYVTLGHVAANNQPCVKKLSPHLKGVTLPTRCGKYIYIYFFLNVQGYPTKRLKAVFGSSPLSAVSYMTFWTVEIAGWKCFSYLFKGSHCH